MPEPAYDARTEDASVRHLVELGYVDPDVVAAEKAELGRRLESELRRAVEYITHGRVDAAVELLEKIARDDPDWPTPHQRLAEIHYGAGRWDKAQSELDWLAHHGVDLPRVALIAGGVALARRDLRTALKELQYARYVDPSLPSVHTLLGTVLFRLRRWNDAEDSFKEAAQQNPQDARARDGMAAICLVHSEYEDAVDWALRALDQDMRLFAAHYHLGLALLYLNRPDDAVRALEASSRLDPARTAPFFWLARAAQQLNDSDRSQRYMQLARRILQQRRTSRAH